MSEVLIQDLSQLLKEEGSLVKELTDVAVKAAEFHTRLESIYKAMESDAVKYDAQKTDQLVKRQEKNIPTNLKRE